MVVTAMSTSVVVVVTAAMQVVVTWLHIVVVSVSIDLRGMPIVMGRIVIVVVTAALVATVIAGDVSATIVPAVATIATSMMNIADVDVESVSAEMDTERAGCFRLTSADP